MRSSRNHVALVLGFVLATGGAAQASLSDGLVAHWQFDETSGTTAHDLAGSHDGTLHNMSDADWIAGKLGGALDFDGSNDYVDLGQFNFGDTFSISAWSYMSSADACRNPKTIIANAPGGGVKDGFKFWVNRWHASAPPPGEGAVHVETGNGSDSDEGGTDDGAFVFGQWNHLVAVVDRTNGTVGIYVNGASSATDTTIRNDFAVNQGTRVGSTSTGGWYWQGRLDDIRVYDRLLTQADVDALFATGSDTTAPITPTGLSATAIGANRIDLDWDPNPETDLYRYAIYRGTSAGFAADESSLVALSTTDSYSDTGLPGGSTFYYKVTALDHAFNESAPTTAQSATTADDSTPPADPTNLAVLSTGSSRVVLSWDANTEADLSHYNIYRDTSPGIDILAATPIATATTNSYKDTGLSLTTDYYYVVTAVDFTTNESGASGEVVGTTDGLVAHWKLDETSGTTAADSSGNGHTGQLVNTTGSEWTPEGKLGGALGFVDDDHVLVDPPVDLGAEWTFAAWIWAPLAEGTTWTSLTRAATDDHQILISFPSWELGTYENNGSAFNGCGFMMNTLSDGWHHLAAVASGTQTVFYMDGTEAGTSSYKSDTDIGVIGNTTGGTQRFSDKLDDVRIYDYPLDAAAIQAVLAGLDVKIEAAGDAAEPSDQGAFTVTLSATIAQDTVVNVGVDGTSTATLDGDYTLTGVTGGTVTIPANQLTATITVTPLDDSETEGDETVVMRILPGSTYNVGSPSQGTVTIVDDDTPPLAFNLTAPSDGAENVTDTPELSWEAAPRATSYTVVVATDASMTSENVVFSQDVGDVTIFTIPDTAGLAYDAEYYWNVTAHNTIGDTDSDNGPFSFITSKIGAPTVLRTRPRDGEKDVPASTGVKIYFSEPMAAGVEGLFTLSDGGDVPGTASLSSDGMVLIFTGPLAEGVTYTATLGGAAADRAGKQLGQDLVFTFTTEAPLIGLAVGEGCAPGTAAAGVALALGLAALFAGLRCESPRRTGA